MESDFEPSKRPAKSLRQKLESVKKTSKPDITAFKSPDEVAADDNLSPKVTAGHFNHKNPDAEKPDGGWRDKLKLSWPPSKREAIIMVVAILLIGGIAFGLTRDSGPISIKKAKVAKEAPKPTTVASNLTGLQVDPIVNEETVTGIMIENSPDARPQSGLSDAGVVFEAIAEGGITRFLALFQDTAPGDVGPIRSARPYYVSWVQGFDAGYAHVGGSPDALAYIKSAGVRDLDQFANSGSYHRIGSRAAPHNMYTGLANLNDLENAKGYTSSNYTGFTRKSAATLKKEEAAKKQNPPAAPTARQINLTLSGPLYNAHYDYDAATNTYFRSEGGTAHVDANGNKQIAPKVVIAMVMAYSMNGKYSVYATNGGGPVVVFQDGQVINGAWKKDGDKTPLTFIAADGKPLELNAGQTWITAVSAPNKVTYAP